MNTAFYDTKAAKKRVNLSINSDLADMAKKAHINMSSAMEQYLVQLLKQHYRQQWLEENANAISEYNQRIEKQGIFSDKLRSF